jgi:LPS O-antigen subunit length determinant protein (WzzB/FepE family)
MTSFRNLDILGIVLRRKWLIAAFVFLTGLTAYIFSGPAFIRPKYKSTAVVYPVNIIPYSNESPTEQLLQLFTSADVRQMMIERHDLAAHYEIDTAAGNGRAKLHDMFDENVTVRKTEFESVKIDVYDVSPDTAREMVNGIIECVNLKARRLQREKTREVVRIFRQQLDVKQRQVDSLERIMSELRIRYGLLDYESQSKEATKSYLKMLGSGASKEKMQMVDSLKRNLEQKGGYLTAVEIQLKSVRGSFNDIRIEYDRAVSDMTKELTYSNVVTRPFTAGKKSTPVRSLIVLISMLSALMLSLIVLIILERKPFWSHAGTEQP